MFRLSVLSRDACVFAFAGVDFGGWLPSSILITTAFYTHLTYASLRLSRCNRGYMRKVNLLTYRYSSMHRY